MQNVFFRGLKRRIIRTLVQCHVFTNPAADDAHCPGLSAGYESQGKVNRVVWIYVALSLLP